MNEIISTHKKVTGAFFRYFTIFFLLFLGLNTFLTVSAQNEYEGLEKPNQQSTYFLGPQLMPAISYQNDNPDVPGPMILTTSCENSNFNMGDWTSWKGCYGTFAHPPGQENGAGILRPCIINGFATTERRHVLLDSANSYKDPYSCGNIRTVFPGEAYSARLGDTAGGGHAEQLKYDVTISEDNYLFIYRYAVVLESPNHNANQQPGFTIQVLDMLGNLVDPCGDFSFTSPTCNNPPDCPEAQGWHYCPDVGFQNDGCYWKDWTTVGMDLGKYAALGTVRIVFTTRGCAHEAHRGYAYISAYCSSLIIQTSLCEGQDSAILTAPPGFRYYWTAITGDPGIDGDTNAFIKVPSEEGATYNCKLTAINGCVVNIQNTLHYTRIQTGFTEAINCAQRPSSFSDTTWVSQNDVTAWRWFFGDPASGASDSSDLKNPDHNFTVPGTYSVTLISFSTDGCSDTAVKQVVVDTLPTITNLVQRKQICSNSGTNVILTANVINPLYTWTATASSVTISGFSDNSVPAASPIDQILTNSGTQPDSVTYIITPHKGVCDGPTFTYVVTVNPLPVPAVAGPGTACAGSSGNIYSSIAGMTNYQWNVSAGGNITAGGGVTNNSVTVTWNTPGPQTVTLNYVDANTCTAPTPTSYPVTVNALPVPAIAGPTGMCLNTTGTYTTAPGMSGYLWTVTAGGTIVSGAGTSSVDINWTSNGTKTITLNYTDANGCTAVTPAPYDVTVNTLPIPSLNGPLNVCIGFTTTYTSDIGMNNYSWTVSGGGTIVAGGGINDASVTVKWTTVDSESVSVNYVVGTGCTAANPTVRVITVHPLPVPAIAGTSVLCAGTAGVIYSTQPGMTNYLWIVSAGGTITAGGDAASNTVTVTWNTFGPQSVSVNFDDANGCTALAPVVYPVTVNPLPVPSVAGPASVCMNSTGTYSTDPGKLNYLWTVSAGGSITSGTGTSSIVVLWSTTGAKTITVNYTDANGCTAAAASPYPVTVNMLPVPLLTGLNAICTGNSATYTSDAGMNNYLWLVSAGGVITAGGGTTDNFVTVTWNTVGIQTVSVNYSMGTGCTAATPTVVNVNVKPRPSVTNAANSTICSGATTSIALLASLPGTTFTWVAAPSSANVIGSSNSGGPVISQTLINTGFNVETVDYAVTPNLNGCDGAVAHYVVTVNPVADAYFNPNGQTFCSGTTSNISILSHVAGATFTWNAAGSSGNITGFGPGATSTISQTLNNIAPNPETVTYTVSPAFSGCPGIPNSVIITVIPIPAMTYSICGDVVTTTTAKPFTLKGGLPSGGVYSGAGVNTGIFYPSVAGLGNHIITYAYSNTWGCSASATQTISVVSPPVFLCNSLMRDIRDNKQYQTVRLGTQCWMAANLNYGNSISSALMQRDNCIFEKYCFNDDPANCTSYGGMYQWDELMQYNDAAGSQGFCPPGWHVPVESEWTTLFNFYTSNGFAGSPLKYTGYSGFNAFLSGTRFNNVNWNFSNFAVMLWSSTAHGPDKAWAHGMNTFNPSVSYYPSSRTHAFSIRCIQD